VSRPTLYCDFDGVLNDNQWWMLSAEGGEWLPGIHPRPARTLQAIIRQTDPEFVVISAWARLMHNGDMTPNGFAEMLKTHGLAIAPERIAHFGQRFDAPAERAAAILRHRETRAEPWAVVDDCDMTPYLPADRFFRIDSRFTLTPWHVSPIVQALRKP
jgi:phosphoglycolate phosphatase-like HAD superfamily hydrolase